MKLQETITVKGIIHSFRLPNVDEHTVAPNGVRVLDLLKLYLRGKESIGIKRKNAGIITYLKKCGFLISFTEQPNLIATVGRAVMAERLAGGATYTGEINYGAFGSDNTTPTNADVALGNETARFLTSSQGFDDNIAYIDFFIAAGTATGTHEEFGNFIDGTGSADSGQLWSHILTGGWVKGAGDSLFISCEYTFN